METFDIFVDRKQTIWNRTFFKVEAESLKDAVKKCLDEYSTDAYDSRLLDETAEDMDPEENNNCATMEMYTHGGNVKLYDNNPVSYTER